ncbi:hypothetical protein BJ165DRAFT_1400780 [Panaeolus papilionaceus]|nr:hypothetical protein BJ165DRAFT_1400780 [Panaeolus papilionaceus]
MAFNFFVPDSSNLVDCDCGCGRTVAYNTWRSHKSGGGSFALQVKRTMLHLRGRDGMDAKVDVDDREMDAEKGMDVEEDVDVGVGVDVDVDVGVDVEQDVDMDIGSGEADDMLAAAATDPPAHLLHAVRVRNRESSQPLAALAGQRSEITHYTERLAQAQNIRWSARPVRQMGDSGPKFFADYSSDDKESDNDDDDDMPPLMPVDEGGGVGDPNEEDDGERDRGEREQEEGQRDDEQMLRLPKAKPEMT